MKAYVQAMLKFIIIAATFLCSVSALAEFDPFTVLGFEIPSIENENWLLEDDRVPIYPFMVTVEMLFFVSMEGKVDSIQYIPEDNSRYLKSIKNSLENIHFYAARFNGKAISFIIPAHISIGNRLGRNKMELEFPFQEPDCSVKKAALEKCLKLNGIELPQIEKFSSYFLGLTGFEENLYYPTGVFEIEIDSLGLIVDYRQIFNFGDDYSKTIKNAILYSEFSPFSYKGRQYSSKFYLIVRFFKTIEYPTEVWSTENAIIDFKLSSFALERSLYLDSIINPPLPVNMPNGVLNSRILFSLQDSLEIEVVIDVKGKIKRSYPLGKGNPGLLKEYKELLEKMVFLPARDINNVPVEYTGRMKLVYNNSNKVGVILDWIPLETRQIE